MGDKPETDGNEPSLELPSLFGRKKKAAAPKTTDVEEPTLALPAEPEIEPEVEPEVEAEVEPEVVIEPETEPEPTVVVEAPTPVASEKLAKAPKPPKPPRPPKAPKPAKEPKPAKGDDNWDESREFKLPVIPGRVAATITGVVVGLLGAVLTWGALQGCEQLKGTDSCGGEGFFLLIFILILMILCGGLLLAAWDVADPKSTSALGVGIVCVLILLLLMEELLDWWMFLVVPVVSAIAYYTAYWVTTALIDESDLDDIPEAHDIR